MRRQPQKRNPPQKAVDAAESEKKRALGTLIDISDVPRVPKKKKRKKTRAASKPPPKAADTAETVLTRCPLEKERAVPTRTATSNDAVEVALLAAPVDLVPVWSYSPSTAKKK